MKLVTIGAVLVATLAITFGVQNVGSQDVLPEENLLVLACNQMGVIAAQENVKIKNCRRAAPDEVVGNLAIIHVRVVADTGTFAFRLYFQRSPWSNQGIMVEYP